MQKKHQQDVNTVQKQFVKMLREKHDSLCLHNHNHSSNVTRSPDYKSRAGKVDINRLNRIVNLDLKNKTIVVEPRVTMEELAKATLPHGFMVPVIPEFKGITVGGAIMGAGIESSSHRYGLFSDTALAYEILLGDGSVIRATPNEHSDIFYAVVGSYGSLGILLSVEFPLVPIQSQVKLTYRKLATIEETVSYFNTRQAAENAPDFIEGLAFARDHIAVIEGDFITKEEAAKIPNRYAMSRPWSEWFYQHTKRLTKKQDNTEEVVDLFEYLFRLDRGAFWIGAYGTSLPLLLRFLVKNCLKLPALSKILPAFKPQEFRGPKDPGLLFRSLIGWTLSSQRLYSWLHAQTEQWVADRFIVQDFCFPSSEVSKFVHATFEMTEISPLWLCPTPVTKHPHIFSPHHLPTDELIINVGVYGIPRSATPPVELTRKLEQLNLQGHGKKALYSHSYYTEEEFWKIYSKEAYEVLRSRYHAAPFTDIQHKVL